MEQLIAKKRMFPSGKIKFCTHQLKIVPIQNFLAEVRKELKVKPINAVGIRAEESSRRSEMSMLEEQDEATVWRPLINHTETNVIEMHQDNNIPPNPLYIKGATRVGCYPCIYARKENIRHLSYTDPDRIEHIKQLEIKVNELRTEEQKPATFFKSKRKDKSPMFIEDIVEWSRTKWKSHQHFYLDDVEEIENQGCLRWGLCEQPSGSQMDLFDIEETKDRRL